MPEISSELVNRYIEGARVFAESKTERLAIQMAANLSGSRKRRLDFTAEERRSKQPDYKTEVRSPRRTRADVKAEQELDSWEILIFEEIHAALCSRNSRHKKQLSVLKDSGEVFILYIASAVATKLRVKVVIVAAPVAALLRIVFGIGISIFCKTYKPGSSW
jgi:hypothetical protein